MKFAKELENELVPEWKVKYLDYKLGKKKIKAVARALRSVKASPRLRARWRGALDASSGSHLPYTFYDFTAGSPESLALPRTVIQDTTPRGQRSDLCSARRDSSTILMNTPPFSIPESQPLRDGDDGQAGQSQRPKGYGSIAERPEHDLLPLSLPDPAISPDEARTSHKPAPNQNRSRTKFFDGPALAPDAYHIGPDRKPFRKTLGLSKDHLHSHRIADTPARSVANRPFVRSMLSSAVVRTPSNEDVPLEAYRDLDKRQAEFFWFLDTELTKIENFYKIKEAEASERLQALRAQLHEMRDRTVQQIANNQRKRDLDDHTVEIVDNDLYGNNLEPNHVDHGASLRKSFEAAVSLKHNVGRTTKAMTQLGTPSKPASGDPEAGRDYVRRVEHNQRVPYRAARRKLKMALQEFYRALELLKSYALVNRTAFRKINKKYDKAVNARPTGRYMTEKVDKTHFVKSGVVDNYIVSVEDLYSRYFERGNRKIAVAKLQSQISRSGDHSQTTFRNGIWLAAGTALGIQGIAYGLQRLRNPDDPLRQLHTSFLLQLYGGYLLGVLLFLLFTLDCYIWTQARINYVFVFEFDSRNVLDWRDRAELPSFFLFLNGLFIWLNFRPDSADVMLLYWPVILVGVTLILMCLPARLLYHRSRRWWGYSNWRLLLAGLYPVEFRDFFLGDMYCSLTYSMGNIEVFFCLYAQRWANPTLCNSTHSRLLGFFATLPAIWRAIQCLRRYYDSRKWFPHLANFGKYTCSILYYMILSLYRIDKSFSLSISFIFFAAVNAVYCSIWDIAMDWSLGNPYSRHPFLRETLGYQRVWTYYVAMALDPFLRFTWIFYIIFRGETQHSTLVSFIIALAEVVRRSVWAAFRVENEHCANVGRVRASRDLPLPYSIEVTQRRSQDSEQRSAQQEQQSSASGAIGFAGSAADLERAATPSSTSLRRRRTKSPGGGSGAGGEADTPIRRGIRRVGTIINQAHTQDFERRKRTSVVGDHPETGDRNDSSDDDDDDDDENDDDDNNATDDAAKKNYDARQDDRDAAAQMEEARELIDRANRAT